MRDGRSNLWSNRSVMPCKPSNEVKVSIWLFCGTPEFCHCALLLRDVNTSDKMDFTFDINKTVAATAYLCDKHKGKLTVIYLMKMLYVSDRIALINWHRPITGDEFFSLRDGPIVSRTYDLFKGNVAGEDRKIWGSAFVRDGMWIKHNGKADQTWLSERERKTLDKVFNLLSEMSKDQLVDFLHKKLPEWKDPGEKGRLPINPEDIFLSRGFGVDEIDQINSENCVVQGAKAAFAA